MPFEIFVIPGLIFFAYGVLRGRKFYHKEYAKNRDVD
jgi:hypothetical protein